VAAIFVEGVGSGRLELFPRMLDPDCSCHRSILLCVLLHGSLLGRYQHIWILSANRGGTPSDTLRRCLMFLERGELAAPEPGQYLPAHRYRVQGLQHTAKTNTRLRMTSMLPQTLSET